MPRNPNAERDNPCLKEQELSYKCLSNNNYDRESCETFFANYKHCKTFWHNIYNDRRAKGISPYLPPMEEREALKTEYMKAKTKQ